MRHSYTRLPSWQRHPMEKLWGTLRKSKFLRLFLLSISYQLSSEIRRYVACAAHRSFYQVILTLEIILMCKVLKTDFMPECTSPGCAHPSPTKWNLITNRTHQQAQVKISERKMSEVKMGRRKCWHLFHRSTAYKHVTFNSILFINIVNKSVTLALIHSLIEREWLVGWPVSRRATKEWSELDLIGLLTGTSADRTSNASLLLFSPIIAASYSHQSLFFAWQNDMTWILGSPNKTQVTIKI